ncbi:MAG: ABC transporter permease [Tropicimonas sp.]|uniref:ABC transporter permease n=1 Tax=Tropicimonas sp. TaxID=2067044 RepID=UPI003A8780CA
MPQTRTSSSAGSRLVRLTQFAPGILLVMLAALFAAINPVVLSPANVINIIAQATPIAILAVGAMVVLVSGGIDMSAAFGVAFCSTLIASRIDAGDGLVLSLLIGLFVMVGIGFLIGLLVAHARITPFVATLAAMIALQGATLAVAQKGVLILKEPTLRWIGIERSWGIPNAIFVTAVVLVLALVMMRRTRFGLRTYAVGSDEGAAELAGVPVRRQLVLVYVVSGIFVFLTAVLMISRVPVVTPNVGGVPLLLDAIAAAVLGGTSVFGGRGTVPGVIVGALIVSLVTTALRVFGTDPSSIELWKGVIIIAALIGDTVITRMRTRALMEARA